MTQNQALAEIKNKDFLKQATFWLTMISCILLLSGLLGFAVFPSVPTVDAVLFILGTAILAVTVFMDRYGKKRGEKLYTENFIIRSLEKYFDNVKKENKLPLNKKDIVSFGFFENLQWSDIEGRRSFSAEFKNMPIKFCELGVYNLFSVSGKAEAEKSVTEKDYIFRGRYFDIKTRLSEKEAENIIFKTERYNLCNKGSVRTEYTDGHIHIFHNVNEAGEQFDSWLEFPDNISALEVGDVEEKLRLETEPYATMLNYIF